MNNTSGNMPGTTAPQAQLARQKKKLTSLSLQLARLSERAEGSGDETAIALLARARANTITALSLTDAVENISSQTALDFLTKPDNDVQVNVAITAFEDVPDIGALKPMASAVAPVVLDDKLPQPPVDGLIVEQPRRFTCCSPDPQKWFQKSNEVQARPTGGGANTCEQPSYLSLTLPIGISNSSERINDFLKLGDSLIAAVQSQVGQARASICHKAGEDSCSLF